MLLLAANDIIMGEPAASPADEIAPLEIAAHELEVARTELGLGLHLRRVGDDWLVDRVEPFAESSGVRGGDRIRALNGAPAHGLNEVQLFSLLEQENPLRISVQRKSVHEEATHYLHRRALAEMRLLLRVDAHAVACIMNERSQKRRLDRMRRNP